MADRRDTWAPIVIVKGSDPVLVDHALTETVERFVGSRDHSLVVDEIDLALLEPPVGLGPVADAAATASFLTDRRVVVARHASLCSKADSVKPLVDYLADPLPTSVVVLVWERSKPTQTLSAVPKSLTAALKSAGGEIVEADPGSQAKARKSWLDEHLAASTVKFDPSARSLVEEHVGEEAARLYEVLTTVEGAFPAGSRVTPEDVAPLLGAAGGVPPWELTDAIDRGDVTGALATLDRMLDGGRRHPMQVLATLVSHFERMLRIDGANAADERAAAEILGIKGSTYPAKKALTQQRRLGSERLAELFALIARADLDLRGARRCPDDVTLQVLVARLASRSRR